MTKHERSTPGDSPRAGTRSARTDALLMRTVIAQLRERGYAGVTIERVAAESGVAKTTIYRRWASKAEMVFDLAVFRTRKDSAADLPSLDTGSLETDILGLAERATSLVLEDPSRSILPGLLADMAHDPALATRLRQVFISAARADIEDILDRAQKRGELTGEPRVEELHAAVLGIPYAHVHLLAHDDRTKLAPMLARQLLTLLRG